MDELSITGKNPYEPRSIKWALMAEDWSDLTVGQIAEVFGPDVEPNKIRRYIAAIKRDTGYEVPFLQGRRGRKPRP